MDASVKLNEKRLLETTSASLHIMAMAFMLCDHLWSVIPGNDWLTCIGRVAYPLFAFMIVEGYFHTKNLKKYVSRLAVFALISEIPFNLMYGSSWSYIVHQNVLITFLISIGLIHINEKARIKGKLWRRIAVAIVSLAAGYILGIVTFCDYNYAGIFTILVFYFFRGRKWYHFAGQLICLFWINVEMLGGFAYEIPIGDDTFYFTRQALALLALVPIWLYRGRQGHHSKPFQYFCYSFYPAHMFIIGLTKLI